ncbi:MAG: hypothetical protein ACRD5H_10935 [Nitrososphaerales archaeon]
MSGQDKPIILTYHAEMRALDLDIPREIIYEALRHGQIRKEGKTKRRASLSRKEKMVIVIYEEYPDQIVVKTITLGGTKRK